MSEPQIKLERLNGRHVVYFGERVVIEYGSRTRAEAFAAGAQAQLDGESLGNMYRFKVPADADRDRALKAWAYGFRRASEPVEVVS